MTRVLLMLLVVLCLPVTAAAQDEDRITLVRQGEVAPYTGYLFTESAAVEWRQRIQLLEARLELDVRHAEELGRIRLEGAELQLSLVQAELERNLRDSRPRWYRHPVFVAVCTAVVTGLVFTTAWKVSQ